MYKKLSIVYYLVAAAFFAGAIINFFGSNNSFGIFWLCLGSTFLCLGSVFVNKSKQADEVINHYDKLIDEDNDPVKDPEPLREHMDKWDGEAFFSELSLNSDLSVLEIGVGTGRLALKAAANCKSFTGLDISPKTAKRAEENLASFNNVKIICADFLNHNFNEKFDVIYSSLTFMHFEDKNAAVSKIAKLLNENGRAVISLDKNQSAFIDMGEYKLKIYPDKPDKIKKLFEKNGLTNLKITETEFAFIISAIKMR